MHGPETGLRAELERRAREAGFALFGIAPATDADGFGRFEAWLDAGYAGQMKYLHKYREHRRHPRSVVESVRSVAMLAFDYARADGPSAGARIARYALGPDYHRFIWDKLNALAAWLMAEVPGSYAHGTCDSAPLLERDFARRAGLGWFGKNTMLLNVERGSFFFLAGLLTSLELPADEPFASAHCGTCTACLDACPTQAFPQPGTLDAAKCLSYLTIELRGPIPIEHREAIGDWLFGCDICQDVCPWNRTSRRPLAMAFPANEALADVDPLSILELTEAEFEARFGGTSLARPRRSGLRRNAAIVLGNTGRCDAIPALERIASGDPDPVVAEAARWALARLEVSRSKI